MVRMKYMSFNETPTKGHSMSLNPKAALLASKLGLSFAASLVIGYTIRKERSAQARLEEHFNSKKEDDNEVSESEDL